MKTRLAAIALVLGFLAAPALALAGAQGCPPCCARAATAPCDGGEPCAELSPALCCDLVPAGDDARALRLAEAPAPLPAIAALQAVLEPAAQAAPARAPAARRAFDTPRRLSVVLRE